MSSPQFPSMRGKTWTVEEETTLLEELAAGLDITTIAARHNRTTGGIDGRRAEIAYKMHLNSIPIDDICDKTLLDEVYIREMIKYKESTKKHTATEVKKEKAQPSQVILEQEIAILKKEVRETKAMVESILEILKAVYEVSEG